MKNKVLTALLSVAISFGLWLYVVTVVSPESEATYYNVPVILDSESLQERGLMIVSDKNLTVDLKLSGNRTDLNQLSSSNITLLADLSQITEPGEHVLKYDISYPGTIKSGTIDVLSREPRQITIVVAEWSRKQVPVNVVYTGTLPEGYSADRQDVQLDHNTVTISGPTDVLDKIQQAKIEVDLTDQYVTFTQSCRPTLCDSAGKPVEDVSTVTSYVSEVKATVKINKLKELGIRVEMIPGGGLTADNVSFTVSRERITVVGSEKALADLHHIILTIDLTKLTESQTLEFDIHLPEGVENVSGFTKVSVDIQIPETITKEFTILGSNFQLGNIPEGLTVEVVTEELTVTVRGSLQSINALTEEDIVVVVDCTDVPLGLDHKYPVVISVQQYEDAGAVGEYTITIHVSQQTPEE